MPEPSPFSITYICGMIGAMESFKNRGLENRENNVEREDGEWCYEKENRKWELVLLPKLPLFDSSLYAERNRRMDNTQRMLEETEEQWKLKDASVSHNEGILRDHPQYHDLYLKWAMRYLLNKQGLDKSKHSGRIDDFEGNLLRPDGKFSNKWLNNEVANGREWIDENCAMELRISEGFIDITYNDERQAELGIERSYSGWWTHDET